MQPQKKPFVVENRFPRRLSRNKTSSIWHGKEIGNFIAKADQDLTPIFLSALECAPQDIDIPAE